MPSPTTEDKGEEERQREEEEEGKGEGTSYYSQIEELDGGGARRPSGDNEEAKKKKKMDFTGESFRSFVDEAFGLRAGVAPSEGVPAAGPEILRPSEGVPPAEDATKPHGVTESFVETQPEKKPEEAEEEEEEEKSSALVRSFMTDSSDVTSGDQEVTTHERGVTPSDDDDVRGRVDDVTMAREIVESVIRDIAGDLGIGGQTPTGIDRRPTEEEKEKEEERTDQVVVDVRVTRPTEADHIREMTADVADEEVTVQV